MAVPEFPDTKKRGIAEFLESIKRGWESKTTGQHNRVYYLSTYQLIRFPCFLSIYGVSFEYNSERRSEKDFEI